MLTINEPLNFHGGSEKHAFFHDFMKRTKHMTHMSQPQKWRTRGLEQAARAATAALSVAVCLAASAASAGDFQVEINQSRAFQLSKPASTVMIGNPSIADVTIEDADLFYVVGRSYGKTNLVALDEDGKQLIDIDVNVVAARSSVVTLTRGAGQHSFNCTPRCERPLDIGDDLEIVEGMIKKTEDAAKLAKSSQED